MRRLEAIASLIKPSDSIVDIGSDHGYLAKIIADGGLVKRIHVTDVAQGPLSSARRNLQGYEIYFHLMDGLQGFDEELDGAVVAGMGGELITKIIDDSLAIFEKLAYFIVQPMQQISFLRRALYERGFLLEKELLAYEGRFYEILLYRKGIDYPYDFRFSKGAYPDRKHHIAYLEEKLGKLNYISEATKGRDDKKHSQCLEEIKALKKHCRDLGFLL